MKIETDKKFIYSQVDNMKKRVIYKDKTCVWKVEKEANVLRNIREKIRNR